MHFLNSSGSDVVSIVVDYRDLALRVDFLVLLSMLLGIVLITLIAEEVVERFGHNRVEQVENNRYSNLNGKSFG